MPLYLFGPHPDCVSERGCNGAEDEIPCGIHSNSCRFKGIVENHKGMPGEFRNRRFAHSAAWFLRNIIFVELAKIRIAAREFLLDNRTSGHGSSILSVPADGAAVCKAVGASGQRVIAT